MGKYHPNSFLADYLFYNSGNECPANYHVWAAISTACMMLCRRVWVPFDYFNVYPNIYCCLVGTQGNRKSVAKDIARDLAEEVFPELPRSAAVMSREAICKFLGSNDAIRTYKDHDGNLVEHRPLSMFVNELKNFISIDPQRMVDFLTDIYDRKMFDVGTKNQGTDIIPNPCLNILACETPDWITARMRDRIISGGFSRRMLYVFETDERERIPFPSIPPGGHEAFARVKASLTRIKDAAGPFLWTPEAREWYGHWYKTMQAPQVPLMQAFYQSKHIQVLKVAMALTAVDTGELVLTRDGLEIAAAIVDKIEPGMQELGLRVGRNELVVPSRNLIMTIRSHGGIIPAKQLQAIMFTEMSPQEYQATLNHLLTTEQVVQMMDAKTQRLCLVLHEKAQQIKDSQTAALKKPDSASVPPTSPPSGGSVGGSAS